MSIASLQAELSSKKSELKTYKKRKKEVSDIISDIDNKLDDEIRAVNKRMDSCISNLEKGLKGAVKVSAICSDMEDEKEKQPESDAWLTNARSNMKSEESRCQRKIDTLEAEIDQIEAAIERLREEERQRERAAKAAKAANSEA